MILKFINILIDDDFLAQCTLHVSSSSWSKLEWAFCRGARVHSDSWGTSDEGVYDNLAMDFDIFAWNNQDFLPFVAAGNFGAQEADSSVSSPSTAKNCMSVGNAFGSKLTQGPIHPPSLLLGLSLFLPADLASHASWHKNFSTCCTRLTSPFSFKAHELPWCKRPSDR